MIHDLHFSGKCSVYEHEVHEVGNVNEPVW